MKYQVSVVICLLGLVACSKPLLVVKDSTPTASVEFKNTADGYVEQLTFDNPVTCGGPKLISSRPLEPNESRVHKLPADQIVTIWTSAWGLPAPNGMIARCNSAAFSTRLEQGNTYKIEFYVNANSCGTVLTSSSGEIVESIQRKISGPEFAVGGAVAGRMVCSSDDNLSSLK